MEGRRKQGGRSDTFRIDSKNPNPDPLSPRDPSTWYAPDFVHQWASGNVRARREFAEMLKKAELTMDDVMAEALTNIMDSFERFDRMLASAEARRNNALHEIDRHRETLADAIRHAVDEVQDAEFRDVETGEASGGSLDYRPPTERQSR